MIKSFAFVCIGIMCLMVSTLIGFHIGSQEAEAQGIDFQSGFTFFVDSRTSSIWHVYAAPNGDVYVRANNNWSTDPQPIYLGNFWGGSPVPIESNTWGGVKGMFGVKK